ncbi:phosphoglycerate/bisphosphoglycerate mutase family protein [Artemisia annua]|uniref:Phosphoglycerate/bisphosphoglycerate mutase family protein n=1 Tax=Artemisia annua TaxID=35608 RepID=A0A2U1MWX4_ARTAN|nr:phosphoglycerate/bisphosphoglycerate mutase family protein [Artemisia annua]
MLSAGLPLAGGNHLLLQNHRNQVGGTVSFPPLKAAKRVVLVRHGQSTWNAEGRIQGSSDYSILTNKGEAQAEMSRQMLIDDSFDICFSSAALDSEALPIIQHFKLTPDNASFESKRCTSLEKQRDGNPLFLNPKPMEYWDDGLIKLFEELRNACIPMHLKLIAYEGTMSGLTVGGLEIRPM